MACSVGRLFRLVYAHAAGTVTAAVRHRSRALHQVSHGVCLATSESARYSVGGLRAKAGVLEPRGVGNETATEADFKKKRYSVRRYTDGLLELAIFGGVDALVPIVGPGRKWVQSTPRLFNRRRFLSLREPQLEASHLLSGARKAARRPPCHASALSSPSIPMRDLRGKL
jgi:hypothetical protein